MNTIRGVIAAVVTPTTPDETVDERGLRKVVRYVVEAGVHGVMTTGGTGEFVQFTREQRKRITEIAIDETDRRVPVIAGTAACGTRETIELTNDAADAGADAAIVVPPYYFKLPERSLREHYRDVAAATEIPIFIYNNPLYTGNPMRPDLLVDLSELKGVVGIKQSDPDLGNLVEVIRLVGSTTKVMTGIDSQFYAALCSGAAGIFSTAACVIPKEMVAIWNAVAAGDHRAALDADSERFRTPVPIESVHLFRRFRTPGEELAGAGVR